MPRLVCLVVLALLVPAAGAHAAETIYATTGDDLIRFSSAAPGTIESDRPLTGLQAGETVRAIDVRPATGELFALGSTGRLYEINVQRATVAEIGSGGLGGSQVGMDFIPSVDRIRVVNDGDANYRLNPLDGSLVSIDTPLNPVGSIAGLAYDNNAMGTPGTAYGIDNASDRLVRIGGVGGSPSANGGSVTEVGPLGVDPAGDIGFDVSGGEGIAYASLNVGGATGLYIVDLTSGAVSARGAIGAPVIDIAVGQARYTVITVLRQGVVDYFTRTYSDAPATTQPSQAVTITGLGAAENVVGVDQRPATGEVYLMTDEERLYLLDTDSGIVTAVGTPFAPSLASTFLGFDFNPVTDRIRVVTQSEENLSVDPGSGAAAAEDALSPSAITGAAYTNGYPGAAETVLYDIDSVDNALVRQDPPASLTTIGELTTSAPGSPAVDLVGNNGFDIPPGAASGLLAADGPDRGLYRVNLAAGTVTGGRAVFAGTFFTADEVWGFTVLSPGLLSTGPSAGAEGARAIVVVSRSGGATGRATVEYATADGTASAGADYAPASGVLRFADGETAKVIPVDVLDDAAAEGAEAFDVVLSRPGEGALLGAATATVTIPADDAPATTPDTTKPLAFVTAAGQKLRARRLKVQLIAGEPGTGSVRARVSGAVRRRLKLPSRRLGSAQTTFDEAGAKTLRIPLGSRVRKRLRRSRRVVGVQLRATVTDRAGNVSTDTASFRLRR